MSDQVLESIADFASRLQPHQLPRSVVAKATDHIVDSLGCALGGFDSEPARIISRLVPELPCLPEGIRRGHVVGQPARPASSVDAAFLNTARIRYLDFNDAYPGGHPSDVLGPLLAMGRNAPGERLVTAVVVAYEVFNRFCFSAQLRERGWDQGLGVALGSCAGLGNLLQLSREQITQALSLASVCNVPMRATRAGRLSMWKGCATAMAARNAMECTLLAIQGMDGPEKPITGRHGLEELVTGRLDLPAFGTSVDDYWIMRSNLKFWPVEYHLQAAVWAALELRKTVTLEDVQGIHVETYWSMWHETASEDRKWRPESRETADHSLPYVFIRAMRDGTIDGNSFEESAYRDEDTLREMAKVTAAVHDDLQEQFPHQISLRARVDLMDGANRTAEIVNPLGHSRNPLDRSQIAEKFRNLSARLCDDEQITRILDAWWQIADVDTAADALSLIDVAAPEGRGQS